MEGVMLQRLQLIISKLEELTTKALRFIDRLDNLKEAEVIVKKLEISISRFDTELNNYLRMSVDPSTDDVSSFSESQLRAEDVLAELTIKLQAAKTDNSQTLKNVTLSCKLPKLNLPEFGGDILEWYQFWDQFNSNIGSRNLSDVDKLLYLKSSLKGDAKRAIEGLETTNNNYQIAISTLHDRYGRQNHIIDAHYAALYKIRKGNNTTEARSVLNEIEKHLRVLSSLGEDINHNHLRFLIMEKFPEDIIYEMKMKLSVETIEEMRKHLEIIISAREDASRITQENTTEEYTTQTLHVNVFNKKNKYKRENKPKGFMQSNQRDVTNKREYKTGNGEMNDKKFGQFYKDKTSQNHKERRMKQLKRRLEEGEFKREVPERKKVKLQCIFCQGSHYNDKCLNVKTLKDRKDKLRGRCYNCFCKGHSVKECRKRIHCVYCKSTGKHNRALCPQCFSDKGVSTSTNTLHVTGGSTVLQTAVVKAKNESDEHWDVNCRVLLDTGSQRSYVTQAVARQLNLHVEGTDNLSIFTFGSKVPRVVESRVVKLQLRTRTNSVITLFANVVSHISEGVPYPDLILDKFKNDRVLADDGSLSPKIDILIGNDYYFTLISSGKIKLAENLFLIESKLGWILAGKTNTKTGDDLSAITYFQAAESKLTKPDLPLDNGNLRCLWELESIGICDPPGAARDEETIKQFNNTIEVIDNRYTVSWPWIEYPPNLPSNFGLSFGRLVNLLKRIESETLFAYNDTLNKQIDKGIIEVIPESKRIEELDHPIHYLPHHGVNSPEKPIRIVYDASAKTKDNKSLNECLHCGPLMLEDLTGMLIRFRSRRIGITADVEKAFLQIALHERDKDVTRFLWLKDITKPVTEDNLMHLRFCRVPFGIISSPFLLNATLKHHLFNSNMEILKQIVNDIYVDNLVTGTESIKEATTLYKTSKKAFEDISMNLREWSSNSKRFMENIPETDQYKVTCIKVLGLNWYLEEDTLHLKLKTLNDANTKRETLKIIASIYDPCGYAVPELLAAKVFLQKLWIEKFKWDTPLPTDLKEEWLEISKNLESIREIVVPRYYFQNNNIKDIQLHCFTDASSKAYAAVVYVTCNKRTSFVIGKSRLVPIKDQENLSIPRLELLGVLIGSRLLKYVIRYLDLNLTQITLWTDSQIVIDWYHTKKLLPPFVARRIEEIRRNVSLNMRYVPTELNPADIATRPTTQKEERLKWLSGPNFLADDSKTWPSSRKSQHSFLIGEGLTSEQERPLRKQIPVEMEQEIENYNYTKDDNINIQEVKRIQEQYFPEEVKGKETSLSRNLGLFIDIDCILRCKGRLRNANWSFDKRYPILIPKDCEFTESLIRTTHEKNYHVGVNHTLSIIRQTYWIPHGRGQVQKVIRKCTNCIKQGGGPYKLPPTPALPQERVNYSSPFTYTGIDYLGPVYVKNDNKEEKRWICLYTCLAVRAILLEIVKDLSAEECLLAMRRFIASRGVPHTRWCVSDNATQFKLTAEVMSNNYYIINKIKWKFIPQLAPWHGGFYERLVALVKHCMKRTLTKQILNDSQLSTVMKEIEAVLNTRPLTNVSSDLEDVLTPSSFLTLGKCLVTEPRDQNIHTVGTTTKQILIDGWKRGQRVLNDFKTMFVNQYLPSLRERYRHSHKEPRIVKLKEPEVGDVVQIKSDNKNRESWKVGKITSVLKGADGQCRVARVTVNRTEFTRSIGHLYPLEIASVPEMKGEVNTKRDKIRTLMDSPVDDHSYEANHPLPVEDSAEENNPVVMVEPRNASEIISEHTEVVKPVETNDGPLADPPQVEMTREKIRNRNEVSSTEKREVRDASIRAREKIKEWTRDLMDRL